MDQHQHAFWPDITRLDYSVRPRKKKIKQPHNKVAIIHFDKRYRIVRIDGPPTHTHTHMGWMNANNKTMLGMRLLMADYYSYSHLIAVFFSVIWTKQVEIRDSICPCRRVFPGCFVDFETKEEQLNYACKWFIC
jgi:hypothetical protein